MSREGSKDYTEKILYRRRGSKYLKYHHLCVLCRVNVLKNSEKVRRKCSCPSLPSVSLSYDSIKARLHHGHFRNYITTFFREKYYCGRAVQHTVPLTVGNHQFAFLIG